MPMLKKYSKIDPDSYWMSMAFFIAANSSCEEQQGAVIVGADGLISAANNKIISGSHIKSAELNALSTMNSKEYSTIYITHTPCYQDCMAIVSLSLINRMVYFPTKNVDSDIADFMPNVLKIQKFEGNLNWMRDYIHELDIFQKNRI